MTTAAAKVCRGIDPITGDPLDPITATALRRHYGNRLVVPPVRSTDFDAIVTEAHERATHVSPDPVTKEITFEQAQATGALPPCFAPRDDVQFHLVISS